MKARKIKIIVVGTRGFPGVQGGVEAHCENLYPRLSGKGCEVIIFTRKPYVDLTLRNYKGVQLIPLSCPKNKFLETFVHTFRSVLKARGLKPDILHIHAIGPSLFALFARILGMKVVVTHHGPDYRREKWRTLAKMFLRFCEFIGMTFANEVIAITKNISDDIKRKFRRTAFVIPNGVEVPIPAETEDVLKRFGLQKERFVLAVGRFVPEKGFDYLIDAFIQLQVPNQKPQIGDWKLVMVGNADHENRYSRDLKEKAGKNSNIILTGFLTGIALQELYSHAGLFVIPSYYEGLPIVLLEAMSYGLSCIASDIPANKNVELSNDRFFKAGDVNALAAKIRELIDKPLTKEETGKMRDIIAEKYNWTKIADETLKVYKQAAN